MRVHLHLKHNPLDCVQGQPRTHRPWTKIMIVVEGIYSMEGEICRLKEIVHIKKKYKAYLYLDEAHSIGALGATGRGCVEYCGVDPKDVDIMMGTFTKSFGSVGGYIAADRALINVMQTSNAGTINADPLAPVCAMQALTALRVICGEDGTNDGKAKIAQLRDNANWMRKVLTERGFEILGDDDSPIIPVMIYNPAKAPAFSRALLKRNVAVVVVGFPATPLLENRVRICLSAAHTRADLIKAADAITEVGDICGFRYRAHEVQPLAQLKSKKE
jgi:serine palmitoyltransferase